MKQKTKLRTYSDTFLDYRCSGDILGALAPIGKVTKEISETMAIVKLMKSIVFKNKNKLTLYDFCAGNALLSVTAAHLLPIKYAYALDKRYRRREWDKVKKFKYLFEDIFDFDCQTIKRDAIVVGIHPCRELAIEIVKIFNASDAKYLFLMPCCHNGVQRNKMLPTAVHDALPKNLQWSYYLSTMVEASDVNIVKDKRCLSPHQYIIKAVK